MSKTRIVGMSIAILLVGVVLGYGLSVAVPYQLPTQEPRISLSTATARIGEQYTVTLTGFSANTEIYGVTVNENPPRMFLGGTTNPNGELTLTGNAPETSGTWPLIACDQNQNILASATLVVTQP